MNWYQRVSYLVALASQWFRLHTFAPRWLPPRWRGPRLGYVLAILAILCAQSLNGYIVTTHPTYGAIYALDILVITIMAYNWGAATGVVALVAALLTSGALLAPVRQSWQHDWFIALSETIIIATVGGVICVFAARWQSALRRAEDLAHSLDLASSRREALRRQSRRAIRTLLEFAETFLEPADQDLADEVASATQRLADLTTLLIEDGRVALFERDSSDWRLVAASGDADDTRDRWCADVMAAFGEMDRRWDEVLTTGGPLRLSLGDGESWLAPISWSERIVGLVAIQVRVETMAPLEMASVAQAVARLAGLMTQRDRLWRQREEARASALALYKTTQRMDTFVSVASHDLRTPLAAMKGNIQMASRRVRSIAEHATLADDVREALEPVTLLLARTDRQVLRINHLVATLLEATRIESGRFEIQCAPCDLAAVIADAILDQQVIWPGREIRFTPPDVPLTLIADSVRLTQAVSNYLSNALKYSDASEPVEIRVTRETASDQRPWVRVAVRDNGDGLSLADQYKIWDRFTKVDGATVRDGSGVGLGMGLFICRAIIERHEGAVGVESLPGIGATFWFTLPLRDN